MSESSFQKEHHLYVHPLTGERIYLVFVIDKSSTDSLFMSFIDIPEERWNQTVIDPLNADKDFLEFTWDRLIVSVKETQKEQNASGRQENV
jgi:hypothetical protein